MAKLYAELTSDKNSKVISKGGDKEITIVLKQGNDILYKLRFNYLGMLTADSQHGDNKGYSRSVLHDEYNAYNIGKNQAN